MDGSGGGWTWDNHREGGCLLVWSGHVGASHWKKPCKGLHYEDGHNKMKDEIMEGLLILPEVTERWDHLWRGLLEDCLASEAANRPAFDGEWKEVRADCEAGDFSCCRNGCSTCLGNLCIAPLNRCKSSQLKEI